MTPTKPEGGLRIAYADPPYMGQAKKHYGTEEVDHVDLIRRLQEFDGFALSCSSPSLRELLPMFPKKISGIRIRTAAWVKPFAFMKPHVWPTYAWEPVIYKSARKADRTKPTPKDWFSFIPDGISHRERRANPLKGQKREEFTRWLLQILRWEPGDEFYDLFPGSGRVSAEVARLEQVSGNDGIRLLVADYLRSFWSGI